MRSNLYCPANFIPLRIELTSTCDPCHPLSCCCCCSCCCRPSRRGSKVGKNCASFNCQLRPAPAQLPLSPVCLSLCLSLSPSPSHALKMSLFILFLFSMCLLSFLFYSSLLPLVAFCHFVIFGQQKFLPALFASPFIESFSLPPSATPSFFSTVAWGINL